MDMCVDFWDISMTKHSKALDLEGRVTRRWLRPERVKRRTLLHRHQLSPYKTPDLPQLARVELAQAAGEVVGDAYVVGIDPEVLEGDVHREEGGREKKA